MLSFFVETVRRLWPDSSQVKKLYELFTVRTRFRAGKAKIWQHLNEIVARLITTDIESTRGEAHVRGIAIPANTFLTNQVISCKEDDVVGNPMSDVQSLVRVRVTSHITLLPFKRFQIVNKYSCSICPR